MSDTTAPATHLPDLLTFDVTVTLEDQLALQMRCLAAPAMRAGQLRRMVATAAMAAVLSPVFFTGGTLIASANDLDEAPFGATFPEMVLGRPGTVTVTMLVMAGSAICSMAVRRWQVRPRVRRVLRRMLLARGPHGAARAEG